LSFFEYHKDDLVGWSIVALPVLLIVVVIFHNFQGVQSPSFELTEARIGAIDRVSRVQIHNAIYQDDAPWIAHVKLDSGESVDVTVYVLPEVHARVCVGTFSSEKSASQSRLLTSREVQNLGTDHECRFTAH
jgi:hypothetical protein